MDLFSRFSFLNFVFFFFMILLATGKNWFVVMHFHMPGSLWSEGQSWTSL